MGDEDTTMPIDKFGWFYKVFILDFNNPLALHIVSRGMVLVGLMALQGCTLVRMILTSWEILSHGMVTTQLIPTLASVPS